MSRPERFPIRRPVPLVAFDALLALACAGLALWAHRRALGVYFHPDDVISMEWARGILPSPDFGLWRLLSGRLFFSAALGVFGLNPLPYHVLNALLHMANVVLLYALARRWGASPAAATLAAGLFGAARPAFSVLQQAVGIGELLALGLVLGALLLSEHRTLAARSTAVGLMIAALLSKEAVLLLPLVLLLPREPGTWAQAGPWRERLRVAVPLLLVSVAAGLTLVVGHVRDRAFGGEAYAMGFGADLFHNLMTYVGWAFDTWNPFYDDPGGISREAWRVGLPLAAALLALGWWTRSRTRLPLVGLAWAGLTLAPVLPLLHHTYANYLYAPLAGLALAVGAGLETLLRKDPAPRGERRGRDGTRRAPSPDGRGLVVALGVAAVLIVHTAASDRLLGARVARRYPGVDLPFDRQLRKSEMMQRAARGLRRASRGGGAPRRIVLYSPPEASSWMDRRTGKVYLSNPLPIEQTIMYRVLDGGRALRALCPGLDSVAFAQRWTADYADFDLCANTPAGDIVDFGRGPDAHLQLGRLLFQSGKATLTINLLAAACSVYPEDARLSQLLDQARAMPRRR